MADRDYLAARVCWRTRLPEQFLWFSLQAVEKELKVILLLNDQSAKGLLHNIEKALEKVEAIPNLDLYLHKDVRRFITYLNRYGQNRYLERGFYLLGTELMLLDKTFWFIRRYCQNFRAVARRLKKPEAEWLAGYAVHFRNPRHLARPHRFHLQFGYLEKVLEGTHGPEQYGALVWKNVFFGKRDKGAFHLPGLAWSASPPHFRYPEVFSELAEILDFPKDVKHALK
jgi:hypothetical protein